MSYHYSSKLSGSFSETIRKITDALAREGFAIITKIDIKATLKEKLNVDFRNYTILGACNPSIAYKAISLESHIGLMLPCNVIIQEHENGEIEISAVNPLETLDDNLPTQIAEIAAEVSEKLQRAVDAMHMHVDTDETPGPS
jgi:uncharacterized protein (DUF302 family)